MPKSKLTIPQRYISLALAADRLLQDKTVVFSHFGPDKLQEAAKDLAKEGINKILCHLDGLEKDVDAQIRDSYPFFRRTYLLSQIRSLRHFLLTDEKDIKGKGLFQAVSNIIGIKPARPFEIDSIKEKMIRVLNNYNFSSYRTYMDYRRKSDSRVSRQRIRKMIGQIKLVTLKDVVPKIYLGSNLADRLRDFRVRIENPRKNLPDCHLIYSGRGEARVCLSDKYASCDSVTLRILIHELVPGHIFSVMYRKMLAEKKLLGEEVELDLLYSSETPYNEGVAEWVPCLIDSMDDEMKMRICIEYAWDHFRKKIQYNVWYLKLIDEGLPKTKAVKYLERELGVKKREAEYSLRFMDEWRIYYPSYALGLESLNRHVKKYPKEGLRYLYLPKTEDTIRALECYLRREIV